jgi:DNA polymerase-1
MNIGSCEFREIWLVDFEFSATLGNRPQPVCLVAHEMCSGRTIKLFQDSLLCRADPPYSVASDSLFVAYYASAELGCHLALDWPLPTSVLDLYVEFRCLTNGTDLPAGNGLLGALLFFGLDSMSVVEKDSMRQLAGRGGPYTGEERAALLNYCESDTIALRKLMDVMLPKIALPWSLHRGRFMKAAARMEYAGVPIDTGTLRLLKENWLDIQDRLIHRVDSAYGVYEGRSFKANRLVEYVSRNEILWPRLASGRLALDDDSFKTMAVAYPQIEPLRQLRAALSQMRLSDLAVGVDDRNRCMLSAFRARTGRNQPSNSNFIFGTASWLRSLIRPTEGCGLAYIDWAQQEFGIAAALSKDPSMLEAYRSGDPYLAFAKQAGAVPAAATKATHGPIRDQFKACALAVQYGMGGDALAVRIGQQTFQARELLRLHHETYKKFWSWSDAAVDHLMQYGFLQTVFGWTIHAGPLVNPRFIRNFPMQANGSEMLRLASCLATERGITVCAPVHDAVLIEAPLNVLESAVEETQGAMAEASEIVLDGFPLRSEAEIIRYPDRFQDERGAHMWSLVWDCIADIHDGCYGNARVPAVEPAVVMPSVLVI